MKVKELKRLLELIPDEFDIAMAGNSKEDDFDLEAFGEDPTTFRYFDDISVEDMGKHEGELRLRNQNPSNTLVLWPGK